MTESQTLDNMDEINYKKIKMNETIKIKEKETFKY